MGSMTETTMSAGNAGRRPPGFLRWFVGLVTKLPASVTVPLLLVGPVLIASVVLTTTLVISGRNAVRTVVLDNSADTHDRISRQLEEVLSNPGRVVRINHGLLEEGRLNLDELSNLAWLMYEQAQVFNTISCISWDGADGRQLWVARYPGSPEYYFAATTDVTEYEVVERRYEQHGLLTDDPPRTYRIDPREFAPFKAGSTASEGRWSPPFEWVNEDGSVRTFALAFVQPWRNEAGDLQGVWTAQFTLYDISNYLSELSLSREGQVFIVDRQGQLLADSRLSPVADAENQRVMARQAGDAGIAHAMTRLEEVADGVAKLNKPYRGTFDVDGRRHLLMASPFDHRSGLSWVIVSVAPESDFTAAMDRARTHSVLLVIAITAATIAGGVLLSVLAVQPLNRLVTHVRSIGAGNLETPLRLAHSPEFIVLSDAINGMTANIREHLRLRHTLALADQVQRSLLPSQLPKVEGLDVAAHIHYCDQTGGDYYDFLQMVEGRQDCLSAAVGDVTGHGVPAAMLMATARGILRSHCETTQSMARMLEHLNRHLIDATNADFGQFMTLLLFAVDQQQGALRWASAGHDMPLLYDPGEDRFIELDGGGLPLGVSPDAEYEEQRIEGLRPGQVLFAGTDGLWETRDERGKLLGRSEVRRVLRENAHKPAREIIEALDGCANSHRGQGRIEDDITLIVIRIL